MTLAVAIALDTRPEKGIRKPRPTKGRLAVWMRRRQARTTTATLHDLGLTQTRHAKVLSGSAKCGQAYPAEVPIAASQLPRRRAARELVSWVAMAYKGRAALTGSAYWLGQLAGCHERTAVRLVHELERGGWVERHRRWTRCDGRDAKCPMCGGQGAPHDRERSSALTPGPALLMALREQAHAKGARRRVAARLGHALKWPRKESRSGVLSDRRALPEGSTRPGGRPAAVPPQIQNQTPLRGGDGVPSARTPGPEAVRDDGDGPTAAADELAAALAETLRAVQGGADMPGLRLRIPRPERPAYKRPAQSPSETPCAALLAPGLYGRGGPFEGACACPRCSPATDGAARREGRPS